MSQIAGRLSRAARPDDLPHRLAPKDARKAKRQQAEDELYLTFLAEQIRTPEQFDQIVDQANPKLRDQVRVMIWNHLPPAMQARIPDPSAPDGDES